MGDHARDSPCLPFTHHIGMQFSINAGDYYALHKPSTTTSMFVASENNIYNNKIPYPFVRLPDSAWHQP